LSPSVDHVLGRVTFVSRDASRGSSLAPDMLVCDGDGPELLTDINGLDFPMSTLNLPFRHPVPSHMVAAQTALVPCITL
jgi:hypothetical protein